MIREQLKPTDEEIEIRELRAFRNGYNSAQKGDFGWRMARRIVAMLFWEWKKVKTNAKFTGDEYSSGYQEGEIDEAENLFKKAYKTLKGVK